MKKLVLAFLVFAFVFSTPSQILAQDDTELIGDNPLSQLWDSIKKKAKEVIDGIKEKVKELFRGKSEPVIPEPPPMPYEETKPEAKLEPKDEPEDARPYIGFRALVLSEDARTVLGLQPDEGLMVKFVYPDSPADSVLKFGDILLKADGRKLSKISDLSLVMQTKMPGDTITFSGLRDSKPFTASIKLCVRPEVLPEMETAPKVEPRDEPSEIEPPTEETPENAPKVEPIPDEREIVPEAQPEIEEPKTLDEMLEKFYKDGDVKDPDPSKGLLEGLGNLEDLGEKFKEFFQNPEKLKEMMERFLNPDKDEADEIKPAPVKPRVRLGVRADDASPEMLQKGEFGVQIIDVYENTPAEKAGIQVGDILVEFAGVKISNRQDLADILSNIEPNSNIEAVVLRNGKKITLEINF